MFKAQLASAEAEIAAAAMTSRGTADDAAVVAELSGRVAALETDLVAAGAATARAEAELQASLAEYTAALASVSAREKAMADELARAERRAKEAERRADATAARLAAGPLGTPSEAPATPGGGPPAAPLAALSKMKKHELAAELVARGLAADGIVAELRQRLRAARRGDGSARSNGGVSATRRRAGPSESALKRPLSSYMLFAQATRAEVMAQSETRLSVGEVGKALGARWKATDAATRGEWEEKARALKAEYDVALAEARRKDAALSASGETSEGTSKTTFSETTFAEETSGRSGVSYYKVIDGERYDRRVLDDCEAFERVNGSVDLGEARRMYRDVSDGPSKPQGRGRTSSVTDVELATLEYALATYAWTDDARAFVEDKMREEGW